VAHEDAPSRILDAAEQMFADQGFDGASMRHLAGAARVNVATAYYHFGSKEELLAAVFNRRFGPVREEQWERLRALERECAGKPVPLQSILEAMLLPPLRLADGVGGDVAMRLMGRIMVEPNVRAQQLLKEQYKDLRAAWIKAITRSVPALPKAELYWRFELLWGAFVFVLCNPSRIEQFSEGVCDPGQTDVVLSQLLSVYIAGFNAPAVRRSAAGARRPGKRKRS
jgi:AcrR family transcriptional regulator